MYVCILGDCNDNFPSIDIQFLSATYILVEHEPFWTHKSLSLSRFSLQGNISSILILHIMLLAADY